MVSYLVRRVVYMLLLLVLLSFVSFVLFVPIELPPGDALSTMIQQMRASGRSVSAEDIRYLEELYGLNRPFLLRYGKWFFNLLQGDMGQSLIHGMPVPTIRTAALRTRCTIANLLRSMHDSFRVIWFMTLQAAWLSTLIASPMVSSSRRKWAATPRG